jgi:hypothetical protein
MIMRGPIKSAVSADRIRIALYEARPGGLTSRQLLSTTDLTVAQLRRGLAELRDVAAMEGLPPLIWTPSGGYQFCGDTAELEAYERALFRRKLTEIGRLITGTIAPHAALHPNDNWVNLVFAQLNGVKASLDILVTHR